jgi:hypothetical protein
MREGHGAHSERHTGGTQKINADMVKVQFTPGVVRSFARLEALVHDSPHFDSDLLLNLQDLAAGKPFFIQTALSEMALITRETMNHVRETGDSRAEKALEELHESLMGSPDPKTVTVLVPKTRTVTAASK